MSVTLVYSAGRDSCLLLGAQKDTEYKVRVILFHTAPLLRQDVRCSCEVM